MAQQLEAALRRPGLTTPAREGASAEPPAARRFGGEPPREPRFSLMERALQSRSFTSPRAKAPTPAPEAPSVHEAAEGDVGASTSAGEEPAPPASAAPPAEPSEGANRSTDAPAETNEAAESTSASIEEEMANLLGRSPGKP
jgi:hypothetical protein